MRRPLPLPVILAWLAAAAMLLPAGHALAMGDETVAQSFFPPVLVVAARPPPPDPVRRQIVPFGLAHVMLPPVLAQPFLLAVPGTPTSAAPGPRWCPA